MRRRYIPVLVSLILFLVPGAQAAETSWSAEYFGGSAYNFTTPLGIYQDGMENIGVNAEYATRPFHGSPYYSARIGQWHGNRGWEWELIHHKLFLKNPPRDVQHFEISHGYNLLTTNRVWERRGLLLRLGAGLVVTHPETLVRGEQYPMDQGFFGTGLFLSGLTAQAAIGKRLYLWKGLFLALEGKLTAAYAIIPVADGLATVPNLAVHGLFGLGYTYRLKEYRPSGR